MEQPEIIMKEYAYAVTKWDGDEAIEDHQPEIVILANREGFQWLSDYFGELAHRDWHASDGEMDPDDHDHLEMSRPPFNQELSDRYEIRVGVIDEVNREAVMEKYDISPERAHKYALIERCRRLIESAERGTDRGSSGIGGGK